MKNSTNNVRPECVHRFFQAMKPEHNNPALLDLYEAGRECQVNVARGKGEPVEGMRNTYTDGVFTWYNFRIENANDAKKILSYPLDLYTKEIGLSGWDFRHKRSMWVGFDFDDLTSHAPGIGITDEELARVREAVSAIPWVEVRRSTGGRGLHLVVYFANPGVPTDDHNVHAALARCVLGMMSTIVGFDLAANVDCCGRILWVWSQRANKENHGFVELKPATAALSESQLPSNWRDHIDVVTHRRAKVRVRGVSENDESLFDTLTSSFRHISLDDSHKALIEELASSGFSTIWVPDHYLLQTHTVALKNLLNDSAKRNALGLVGVFDTLSEGLHPETPNCFLFPSTNGAWNVFRFTPGTHEASTWIQDGIGWTRCDFNCRPTLAAVAHATGGVEDPDKPGYVFDNAHVAFDAAKLLGQEVTLPGELMDRKTRLKPHKDGRLVVEVEKRSDDAKLKGWVAKKEHFSRVYNTVAELKQANRECDYDDLVRALITPKGEHAGFMIRSDTGEWDPHWTLNAKMRLQSLGIPKSQTELVLGTAIGSRWTLVNVPFQPEFLGGRRWNLGAAQFQFLPARLSDGESPQHPHWDRILKHIGTCLDESVRQMEWCQRHDIVSGADWLLYLIACILRDPFEKTPYLFLWGPEDSGKSIFHEAFSLLVTKGVVSADRALTNRNGFNGELANAVLAVVEETDLSQSPDARNRMKEWVTGLNVSIRRMRTDQYEQRSTLHFIQTANSLNYCPVWPGDSRITVCHVPALNKDDMISKNELLKLLEDEAPHFMTTIMELRLPEPADRLRIPVVETPEKLDLARENAPVAQFIDEKCDLKSDEKIAKCDLYDAYHLWCKENGHPVESRQRFGNQLIELSGGAVRPKGKVEGISDGTRHDAYQGICLAQST